VLANSAVASVLIFLHARRLQSQAQQLQHQQQQSPSPFSSPSCWDWRKDILVPAIIAYGHNFSLSLCELFLKLSFL
jgi:hypothetical protein